MTMTDTPAASHENYLELDEVMADGYGIVSRKVMRAEFITNNAKALYSYLCSFAGSGSTAFPSTETIKRELRFCKDAFYAARRELASYGIIEIETRRTRKGARTIYHLCTSAHIAEDAKEVHASVEAARSWKAAKAAKARAKSAKAPRDDAPEPIAAPGPEDEQDARELPQGFSELASMSLKKIRRAEYAQTIDAYRDALRAGYAPEAICKAYVRYVKRYRREHPETIRYAKHLLAYLTEPAGLAFDAPKPTRSDPAPTPKSQEQLEAERAERARAEAEATLAETDPRYQALSKRRMDLLGEAVRCGSNRDQEAYEQKMAEASELGEQMDQMVLAHLAEGEGSCSASLARESEPHDRAHEEEVR